MSELLLLVGVVVVVFLYRICKAAWLGAVAGAAESVRDWREMERRFAEARRRCHSKRPMRDVTPAKGVIDLPSDQYRAVDQ